MSPGQPKQATKQSSSTSAPKQAQKPSKQRTTPERWHTVAREEVLNGKDFMSALLAAQYSESYAKGHGQLIKVDDRYCQIKEQYRQELYSTCTWDVPKWREEAIKLYNQAINADDRTNANSTLDKLGKHLGAYEADKDKPSGEIGQLLTWLSERKSIPSKEIPILEGKNEDENV